MGAGEIDLVKIIFEAGIIVKCVLGLLLLSSVFSWAVILKKKKQYQTANKLNGEFLSIFRMGGNFSEIFDKCNHLPNSPIRRMFLEGHYELRRVRDSQSDSTTAFKTYLEHFGIDGIERALDKGAVIARVEMEEGLSALASIGSVTPFVGLFGTVWGIINSFTGLAKGGGTLELVAPGIAEALVATAFGLFAAIPAVWFYNHYQARLSKIEGDMECFAQDFINTVQRFVSK